MTMPPGLKGLDASAVQGRLPIQGLVDKGCKFLIHKCQQGNDGKDPCFEENTILAMNAGMTVGAYHFLYPLPHLDPATQAVGFFKASDLGAELGDLPPALDFEWPEPQAWAKWGCTAQQISDWTARCAERMVALYGRKPLIYTYPYFMAQLKGADVSWLASYPLWIASYKDPPAVPAPWSTWTICQYDGNGGERMPNGVDADFDVFNGDQAVFDMFTGKARGPADCVMGPAAIG